MAYKRYRGRRRQPVRGRRRRRPVVQQSKFQRYANYAVQGFKTALYLRSLINTEFKDMQLTAANQNVTDDGYVVGLCYPTQGDGDDNRDGDSIRLKNLRVKGMIQYNSAQTTYPNQLVRVIVFNDKANTVGGDLTTSALLDGGLVGTSQCVFAPKDRDNMYRTKVLFDRVYSVSSQNPVRQFSIRLNNINFHTQFENGTTTMNTNALKIAYCSNVDAAQTDFPKIQWVSDCSFIDN